MGLVSSVFDWVSDRFDDAKNWIEDRVDDIKDFFGLGSRGSYSGSVEETVDIDRVLNDFRTSISPDAKELEKKFLDSVLSKFDEFIESEVRDYPELVSALKKKKKFWMSSMLPMFVICSNSRIFSRRAFSSGVRFFLAIW